MASIRELRDMVRGATQFKVADRSGVPRIRLSFAECGYLRLEPEEERAVRTVLADLAGEGYNAFLNRLREPQEEEDKTSEMREARAGRHGQKGRS